MEDNFCLSSSNSSNSNGYIFASTEEYSEIVEKSLPIYQCMNTNFQEDDYWLIKDSMFSEYDMEQQYNNKLPLIDDFNASSLLPFNSLNFSSHDHAGATGDNNKLPLIEDISNALIEDDSRLMIENMFISDYVEKLPLIEDINASSSLSLSDSFNFSSHDHAGATDDTNKLPLIEDVTASSSLSLSLLNSFDLSSNHAGATNVNNNRNNNLACKKKLPKKVDHWTREEHRHFLEGLICVGEGKWKRISEEYVATKTPTQVASHAQKYFKRQEQKLLVQHNDIKRKPRSSILDMTTLDVLKDNPAIMKMK